MRACTWMLLFLLGAAPLLPAQNPPTPATPPNGAAPAEKPAKPKASVEGKAALQGARQQADAVRDAVVAERPNLLERAARAYEQVAVDFAAEPMVAAQARWEAGELWRRHGSQALAETCYLEAAKLDEGRYGQRGTMAAADMQRRLKRYDEAMATYRKAEALGPGTTRGQESRLWVGRLLEATGKLPEAVAQYQSAMEAASGPRQVIEAANFLAKCQIARGDLTAAAAALATADDAVANADEPDVTVEERLRRELAEMSARKALQRALDKQTEAAKDAGRLEQAQGKGN